MSKTPSDTSVLIVDDEEQMTELYSYHLKGDYDVETANSGKEALNRVSSDVDAMLLDRRMPGMTGDDVLRKMDKEALGIAVIMVTAIDPDVDIIDMPFDDYLCKPADKPDLIATIDHHVTADGDSDPVGATDKIEDTQSAV